jgi:hypothetical protein
MIHNSRRCIVPVKLPNEYPQTDRDDPPIPPSVRKVESRSDHVSEHRCSKLLLGRRIGVVLVRCKAVAGPGTHLQNTGRHNEPSLQAPEAFRRSVVAFTRPLRGDVRRVSQRCT